jgi:uncharacterized secreted repeat protein (TIGR03808 family)
MTAFNSWTGVDSPTLDARYVKAFVVDAATYGDGVTDATTHIQGLLDAAQAVGGTVFLPPGDYLTGNLTITAAMTLEMATGAAIKFDNTDLDNGLISISGDTGTVRIVGGCVDGNNETMSGVSFDALLSVFNRFGSLTVVEGVEVKNAVGNGVWSFDAPIDVIGCHVHDCTLSGVAASGVYPTKITGNLITDCAHNGVSIITFGAVAKYAGGGVVVSNNRIENITDGPGATGAYGNGILTYYCSDVTIVGNSIEGTDFSFIRANLSDNVTITGNTCKTSGEVGIFVEFGASNVTVASNTVDACQGSGISLANADDGAINMIAANNTVSNFGLSASREDAGVIVEHGLAIGNIVDGDNNPAAIWGVRLGVGSGTAVTFDAEANGNLISGTKYGIGLPLSHSGTFMARVVNNSVVREDANYASFLGAVGAFQSDGGDGSDIDSVPASMTFVSGNWPAVASAEQPPAMILGSRLRVGGGIRESDGSAWTTVLGTV